MKLIVGLGNPGADYEGTRHNVGFDLIDRLASANGIKVDERIKGVRALIGRGRVAGEPVLLVKPLTFMNLSGEAVIALARRELTERDTEGKERIALEKLIVITDDIHLPVGRIRLRSQGSSGGQNGLKSIAGQLGTQEFARLRIGVGEPPPGLQVDWVLGRFSRADRQVIEDTLITSIGAVEIWVSDGIQTAMNRFNGTGA